MVCVGCGKVIEFNCSHCADVHGNLADKHGFQIMGVRVKLLGYCADCQARKRNETRGDNFYENRRYS
jgi:Fur family ferric uptake transcriptional regulator